MAEYVMKVPATMDVEILKSLEGSNGTRVNVIEDADGNHVISLEDVDNPEFREVKNAIKLGGHKFEAIPYKPKAYPKSPEEL